MRASEESKITGATASKTDTLLYIPRAEKRVDIGEFRQRFPDLP